MLLQQTACQTDKLTEQTNLKIRSISRPSSAFDTMFDYVEITLPKKVKKQRQEEGSKNNHFGL